MKKNSIWYLSLAACLVLMAAGNGFAGAWTQEKGKSYHRLAANYYFADKEFNEHGDSRSMEANGEFTDYNLNYYLEYGAMDELTVIASAYYKTIEREDDYYEYDTRGMGDVDLAARYLLASGETGVFSVQGLVKVPKLYDEDRVLPLGNGQYDYELRFLYGRSLWSLIPGYMNLEAGYRWRAERPSDEFRYLVEIGSDLGKNFYARAKLDAIVCMDNGDDTTDASGNPASTLEYDLTKLDLAVGYQMTRKLGVELGYTPELWGETTAKGTTWTLALTWQPRR